jgi:hypothetical protein
VDTDDRELAVSGWRPCCRVPVTLISLQDRPEMYFDRPYALPLAGVAVPFTVDDRFHSHSKVVAISLAARGLWVSAGAWSSDHRKGGVVPDRVLATLGSTPELEAELLAAGLWKRVRRGICFHDWEQWNDTPEMAAKKEAEVQRKRDMATLRQQNKREKDKAGLAAKLARDVTQASRKMPDPVTQSRYKRGKKPKASGGPVTRDIGVTSRVTPGPSHARADFDFDFDFDLDPDQVSQSGVINAGTREAPASITAVIDAARTRGLAISAAEAATAIARIRARPKTPKHIYDPVKYFTAAIENEEDLYAELLDEPPPMAEILAGIKAEDARSGDLHPYDPDPRTGVCRCDRPKSNWRHEQRSEEARPA